MGRKNIIILNNYNTINQTKEVIIPKGNSFKRAFRLKEMLDRTDGATLKQIMHEFNVKKPSAMRMIDQMSELFRVSEHWEFLNKHKGIVYRIEK